MKNFTIDPDYLTSVDYTRKVRYDLIGDYSHYGTKVQSAIHDLTSTDVTVSGTEDHPEFSKLRFQLETEGYIRVERSWWNGDYVIKPFVLNDYNFKVGESFSCASALGIKLKLLKSLEKSRLERRNDLY